MPFEARTNVAVYPAPAEGGAARRFAEYLAGQTAGSPILRYSQRLDLLRAARRFGVERFEANLLIAAVLERKRQRVAEQDGAGGGPSVMLQVATFLLVQGALLAGAWWALLG